ncbi:MAG: DUF5678 domain-containing protein [Tannerella sp.]|jgi:hypothetical protein|nr:DUF5678 domain-containing protein [Tannerella sp.]
MLKDLFLWYLANQDRLVKRYNGKYVAISGNKVVGSYDSDCKAVAETEKKYPLGTFIVQKCTPGTEAYTFNCFSPNVTFV